MTMMKVETPALGASRSGCVAIGGSKQRSGLRLRRLRMLSLAWASGGVTKEEWIEVKMKEEAKTMARKERKEEEKTKEKKKK
jgi:hypothetical protein